MATYVATARRTGDWWALEVPDVPGAYSQCKRLDQAEEMAREAIALVLDIDETDVEVDVQPVLDRELSADLKAVRAARAVQEEAVRRAVNLQAQVVQKLVRDARLSYRDAGAIVGISHQRVGQVLNEAKNRSRSSDVTRRVVMKNKTTGRYVTNESASRSGGRPRKGSKI